MKTYVILFRGINVGGKNLLPMKELKRVLQDEGYQDARTYIQSGNVVLTAKASPLKHIASLVEKEFGFSPKLMVLEKAAFLQAAEANPYASFQGNTVHFYFCAQEPELDTEKLASLAANGETYQQLGNVFYLHAPHGIGRSKLVANIERCLGVPATGRNLNTVLKLRDMLLG
ncbi:MAG: DUF1697 domain-containing protein [Gammaproteobacteria bacterium]|nr:DUF1697 domain-containing protein [Gammaproteobacteria bacterium]